MRHVSHSHKDTEKIAKLFLNKIGRDKGVRKGATIIALSGNLGAGKTAFMQAVARNLGIKRKINSPTFVIIKNYPIPEQVRYGASSKKINFKFLFHIDAYRLRHERELLYLGWRDILKNPQNLVFIEWPENVKAVIPKRAKYIYITHGESEHQRTFRF